MRPDQAGLTPLEAVDLPEPLVALCRARQIVTAEQARDLVGMLLHSPNIGEADAEELKNWLDQLDRLIGMENKPPEPWEPTSYPIGGVLPPDEWHNEEEPKGLRSLPDDDSEDRA